MSKLEETVQVVNQTQALLLSKLPITDPDFFDLIKDLNQAGFNLNTVEDVLGVNGNQALTRLAIEKIQMLLNNYLTANPVGLLNINLDSAYNGLVNQIKQEFPHENSDEVLTNGKLLLVFIPESDLQDKSQILIDEIRTFLSPLDKEEYDIACYSWGYGKLAESIDDISKRYPNLNITRIKKDLESRLHNSLTKQSKDFLSTVRQDMIQDLRQNLKLQNLFQCFTEHPANANETEVEKFYEFVDLFCWERVLPVVEPPVPIRVENLLRSKDVKLTREEIIQRLNLNPDVQNIFNNNNNVYASPSEQNNIIKVYRHVEWLKSDFKNRGLDFDTTTDKILEKLKKYFYDNPQVKKFNQDDREYRILHLREYFSKIINQSLLNEDDYYNLPSVVDYDVLLYLVKTYIKTYELYYLGDRIENITNCGRNLPNTERIRAADLILRVLNAYVFPMSIDELVQKTQGTTTSVYALLNTLIREQEVIQNKIFYTTPTAQQKYKTIMNLIQHIDLNQTTLQEFTKQANANEHLRCDYSIYFYQSFLAKKGYEIVDGFISEKI